MHDVTLYYAGVISHSQYTPDIPLRIRPFTNWGQTWLNFFDLASLCTALCAKVDQTVSAARFTVSHWGGACLAAGVSLLSGQS